MVARSFQMIASNVPKLTSSILLILTMAIAGVFLKVLVAI
jgi:hypothetical protein